MDTIPSGTHAAELAATVDDLERGLGQLSRSKAINRMAEQGAEPLQPLVEGFVGAVGRRLRLFAEPHEGLADGFSVEVLAGEEPVELLQALRDGDEILAFGRQDLAAPVAGNTRQANAARSDGASDGDDTPGSGRAPADLP